MYGKRLQYYQLASQTLSHFGQSLKKIQWKIMLITRNLFKDCHCNDSHEMSRLSCRKPDKTGNFWADILQYYSWYSSDYTVKHSENFQCLYYRKKYSSTPTICWKFRELSESTSVSLHQWWRLLLFAASFWWGCKTLNCSINCGKAIALISTSQESISSLVLTEMKK